MKVAFTLFGGKHWHGGINYLANLFSALQESSSPVRPVLFTGTAVTESELGNLTPFLRDAPVKSILWDKGPARKWRTLSALSLQSDFQAERIFRDNGIDLVFQHSEWYGFRFALPTIAWIADFQHRHLPQMFSRTNYLKRELGYHALAYSADTIMVSSASARMDCESFYPASREKLEVLPFAARVTRTDLPDIGESLRRHGLPRKFFFMPNQFWKHKNHLAMVAALRIARQSNPDITIVCCGNLVDGREPAYPQRVLSAVKEAGLEDSFRVLGMIPFNELEALLRTSAALINPSLFEGWSTTVEEAKAFGVPMLLSDIPVHRDQAPSSLFFNPYDAMDIARVLVSAWQIFPPGPRLPEEQAAAVTSGLRRQEFSTRFQQIALLTLEKSSHGK